MDGHVLVTISLAIVNIIVIPWAVFVTLKLFNHDTKLALHDQNNGNLIINVEKLEKDVAKDFESLKKHIDSRVDDLIKLITDAKEN